MISYIIQKEGKKVWLEATGGDDWGTVRSIKFATRFSKKNATRFAKAYGPGWTPVPAPVVGMTRKEWKAKRKAVWESMNGCNCPVSYKDKRTKEVHVLTAGERCTKEAIRCNGRLKVWSKRKDKLGPEPKA